MWRRPACFVLPLLTLCLPLPTEAALRRVDVGDRKLRVSCAGVGGPTVVFEAGLGETLETWKRVLPPVARFTRACAYDRAGLGRSDPGPLPRTASRIVEDLRSLLARAHVPPPYVLVGHSFGGLCVRLYASRWPQEVAGLVLVEATHEDYPARERTQRTAEHIKMETSLALAAAAARSEFASLEESAREVREAGPLPDIPIVVVSASRAGSPDPLRRAWDELQRSLARLTSRTRHVVAEGSGHYVQFDRPELVVGAVREVVDIVREEARPVPRVNAPPSASSRP